MESFFREGYLIVRALFTRAEVAQMRSAFARLEASARPLQETSERDGSLFVMERSAGPRLHRVVWCCGAEPVLDSFGTDARLVHMASRLLGSRSVCQLICQAHFKLPGDGVHYPWHQDSSRRRYGTEQWADVNRKGSYVQTLTAIDPMTRDNGPVLVIPGSCQLGHVEPQGPGGTLGAPWVDAARAQPLLLEPGDVALIGPYTIHGSEPNQSRHARRLFINGFASPGANRRRYPGAGKGREVRALEQV